MQVLLRRSEEKQDIKCAICAQGFRIYWERTSLAEQDTMRTVVLNELRRQHTVDQTEAAHPAAPFNVPNWQGSPQFSGAAMLGGLSTIRRVAPPELDFKRS